MTTIGRFVVMAPFAVFWQKWVGLAKAKPGEQTPQTHPFSGCAPLSCMNRASSMTWLATS